MHSSKTLTFLSELSSGKFNYLLKWFLSLSYRLLSSWSYCEWLPIEHFKADYHSHVPPFNHMTWSINSLNSERLLVFLNKDVIYKISLLKSSERSSCAFIITFAINVIKTYNFCSFATFWSNNDQKSYILYIVCIYFF